MAVVVEEGVVRVGVGVVLVAVEEGGGVRRGTGARRGMIFGPVERKR